MRKGWYICRSVNSAYHRSDIVTAYNIATVGFLRRCSFALRPLTATENPLMNCFDSVQTPKPPGIPGKLPKPTTRPKTRSTPTHKPEGEAQSYIISRALMQTFTSKLQWKVKLELSWNRTDLNKEYKRAVKQTNSRLKLNFETCNPNGSPYLLFHLNRWQSTPSESSAWPH